MRIGRASPPATLFRQHYRLGQWTHHLPSALVRQCGGLSSDRVAGAALLSHTFIYSLAYVPAFVWISSWLGWQTLFVAAGIAIPHFLQDDARLVTIYIRSAERMDTSAHPTVVALIDQALHMVALFGVALLVSALK